MMRISPGFSKPKTAINSGSPCLSKERQACLTTQSVSGSLPSQSLTIAMTISGLSFEISFKLLATLLLTYSFSSSFNFSRIFITGLGSFLKRGNAMAHGKRGRQPSVANLRTWWSDDSAHVSICCIAFFGDCLMNGLIANSELEFGVKCSRADIDAPKSPRPYNST